MIEPAVMGPGKWGKGTSGCKLEGKHMWMWMVMLQNGCFYPWDSVWFWLGNAKNIFVHHGAGLKT